jgi:transposase-like protein
MGPSGLSDRRHPVRSHPHVAARLVLCHVPVLHNRNGVAAKKVQRDLGVTYKTARRMCNEIRKYIGQVDGTEVLGGVGEILEVDEALIGGKMKGTGRCGRHLENKTVVLGMLERTGNVMTTVVSDVRRATLIPQIVANVAPRSEIHTDYLHSYKVLGEMGFTHKRVNHSKGEYYSPEGVTTNTLEGFWAIYSAESTAPAFMSARSIFRLFSGSLSFAGTCVTPRT